MFGKLYVKLYFWFLLIFAVTQFVNFTITSKIFRRSIHQELDTQFRHEAEFLKDQFKKNCSDISTASCKAYLHEAGASLKWNFWVISSDGKTVLKEATHPLDIDQHLAKTAGKEPVVVFVPENPFMALYPLEGSRLILALEREMLPRRTGFPFVYPFLTATLIIAILVLPLSARLTRPLRRLHNLAAEWSEGRLERRIDVKGRDEIADLSHVFNSMAANLKRIIDQRKEFLALISHELKSPLTRMRLAVHMITDRNTEERTAGLLAKIQREISESESLVEKLLALSKVEMNVSDPTTQHANLKTVLNSSLSDVIPMAKIKGISLQLDGNDRKQFTIPGDSEQLQHALSNIIENAVKFSPTNSPVTVHFSENSGKISVEITDQGPGVAREDYKKIFEPFYRGKATNGKKGSGLGLFISQRIIEKHNGTIEAFPNDAVGMTVRVTLPSTNSD
jgi:signal transduction histidine kinase